MTRATTAAALAVVAGCASPAPSWQPAGPELEGARAAVPYRLEARTRRLTARGKARARALARICAGEAGVRPSRDCSAIHAVLTYRARVRRSTWLEAARAYSGRHLDRGATHARRWVAWLSPELEGAPRGWPSAASWEAVRPSWRRLVDQARRVVLGLEAAPCAPHHWGAPYGEDLRRAREAGAVRARCGATANLFWRRGPSS